MPSGGRKLFFRGHADKEWKLLPSVLRIDDNGVWFKERELILDYKQVSVSTMDYRTRIENILVEMQHYGIPTRMMDWSLSPLVALYFACQSHIDKKTGKETDGAVYALNPWSAYRRIVAKIDPHPELMDILKESRMLLAQSWDFEAIRRYIEAKYRYPINKNTLRAPVPFVGRYMVNRVSAQQSGFIMWGDGDDQSYARKIHLPLNKYSDYEDSISEPFIVSADCKHDVLTVLRQLGVDSFTIFPDETGIKKDIEEIKGLFKYK